jgi:Fur family ferric uptake transcriptional regulator
MPTAERLTQTLRQHQLHSTPIRRAVLAIMADTPFALSGHDIEQLMPTGTDRITLYRTLKSFQNNGLVHQVLDDSGIIQYAACSIECSSEAHFDNHVHFKCTICQHIFCLSQVAIPAVTLPTDFEANTCDYLVRGVCRSCQPIDHREDLQFNVAKARRRIAL